MSDDWRPLAVECADAMAERTGLKISPQCTAVQVEDEKLMWLIQSEAYEILSELRRARWEVGRL